MLFVGNISKKPAVFSVSETINLHSKWIKYRNSFIRRLNVNFTICIDPPHMCSYGCLNILNSKMIFLPSFINSTKHKFELFWVCSYSLLFISIDVFVLLPCKCGNIWMLRYSWRYQNSVYMLFDVGNALKLSHPENNCDRFPLSTFPFSQWRLDIERPIFGPNFNRSSFILKHCIYTKEQNTFIICKAIC